MNRGQAHLQLFFVAPALTAFAGLRGCPIGACGLLMSCQPTGAKLANLQLIVCEVALPPRKCVPHIACGLLMT